MEKIERKSKEKPLNIREVTICEATAQMLERLKGTVWKLHFTAQIP